MSKRFTIKSAAKFGAAVVAAAAVAVAALPVSGCNYKAHFQKSLQDYASRSSNDPKMRHERSYGTMSADPARHDNLYFEFSAALTDKVAALPGVGAALVFLTDKNAYAGITTDASGLGTGSTGDRRRASREGLDFVNLSSELRQTIGDTIRKEAPLLREVHISDNPEFVNQALGYAQAAWMKKPLSPLTADFNRLVRHTFGPSGDIPLPPGQPPSAAKAPQ